MGISTEAGNAGGREKLERARAEQRTGESPSPFIALRIIFVLRRAIRESTQRSPVFLIRGNARVNSTNSFLRKVFPYQILVMYIYIQIFLVVAF